MTCPKFLLVVSVWMMAFVTSEAVDVRPLVSTSYGQVQGIVTSVRGTDREVHTFRSIPFAKPPVGQLRFSPPLPPKPWTKVRDASGFPPMCTQAPAVIALQYRIFQTQAPSFNISEDCLYLNIHVPAPDKACEVPKKKPVMVWIYGGALISGAASLYEGSALAAYEDVIVVSVQYRLGVLGFLSTGDAVAPGNWGLLDQIEALKWVKKEIANFGGDPDCVTIFGQSAGAISISVLMLSPLAEGLFHRVIAESGSAIVPGTVDIDTKAVIQFRDAVAKANGCPTSTSIAILNCLRKKTASDVNMPVETGAIPFLPIVVDGVVLPKSPKELLSTKAVSQVPTMIGTTTDECGFWVPSLFQLAPFPDGITPDQIPIYLLHYQALMGSLSAFMPEILNEYVGKTKDPIQIRDGLLQMCKYILFRIPARKTAEYLRDAGIPVYVYEFAHRSCLISDLIPTYVQSDHGQEMTYVFGGPFLIGEIYVDGNFTADETELSKTIMKLWATFARTGNPNSRSVQGWGAWDQSKTYRVLDIEMKNGQTTNLKREKFWDKTLKQPGANIYK